MLNLNGAGWRLVGLDEFSESRALWVGERWNWRTAAADWQALHLDGIPIVRLKTRHPNRLIVGGMKATSDNAISLHGSLFIC